MNMLHFFTLHLQHYKRDIRSNSTFFNPLTKRIDNFFAYWQFLKNRYFTMSAFMSFITAPDFLTQMIWMAFAGALSGILAGLLGIGGGAVLVPVLYEFFGLMGVDEAVRTHLAVGTSLGVIVPTSIRSFLSHKKRGAVDMNILKIWFVPLSVGVILGAISMLYISGVGLRAIFGIITFFIGLKMILNLEKFRLGQDIPSRPLMSVYGFMIGYISKLMGIGGGVMGNTVLTLYNRPIHQAVATSSGLGVMIAIPGVVGDMVIGWSQMDILPIGSIGYVSIVGVLLLTPTSVLCAPLGVKIAHALPKRWLEIAFAVFLFSVSARFLYTVIS